MLSEKTWRADAVLLFCAAQFGCLFLGMSAAGLLRHFGVNGFRQPEDFGTVLLATLAFQGATWLLIPIFLRQHHADWREIFGFRGSKLPRALLLAIALVIIILPVVLLLQGASIFILTKLGWPPGEQTAVTLVSGAKTWWTRAYLDVFALALAPVAEEFIFRGMLFPFVKQIGWPKLAWFGVSFLFALIHFDAAIFVPLFVLALALTWLYEFTGNLLAPIFAHALFNAANLIVLDFGGQINQLLHQFLHPA